jgi:hypothetical protein
VLLLPIHPPRQVVPNHYQYQVDNLLECAFSNKRENYCNIPLLRAHVIDLFFEDTCVQVIQFSIWLFVSLMDSDDDIVGL